MKYCNNSDCSKYKVPQEGKFCGECGSLLSEHSVSASSDGINVVHSNTVNNTDSHNIDSHNTVNNVDSHDTVHSVTNVYLGSSADEMSLRDKKMKYREFCKGKIVSGIVSPELRKELDDYAASLGLEHDQMLEIEKAVKESVQKLPTGVLTDSNRMIFDNVKSRIFRNEGSLSSMISELQSIASSYNDEVCFYYNMLLAIEKPSVLFSNLQNAKVDDYWQTFWASYAYAVGGNMDKAVEMLNRLDFWNGYPSANTFVLATLNNLTKNSDRNSTLKFFSKVVVDDVSIYLKDLVSALDMILKSDFTLDRIQNGTVQQFYFNRVFKFKVQEKPKPAPKPFTGGAAVSGTGSVNTGTDKGTGSDNGKRYDGINDAVKKVTETGTAPVPVPDTKKGWKKYAVPALVAVAVLVIVSIAAPLLRNALAVKGLPSEPTVAQNAVAQDGKAASGNVADAVPATGKQAAAASSATGKGQTGNAQAPAVRTAPEASGKASGSSVSGGSAATKPSSSASKVSSSGSGAAEKVSSGVAVATLSGSGATAGSGSEIASLKSAAESGDKDSRFRLGMMYYNGDGVSKNYSEAFRYLEPLARDGYTGAFFPVAEMYHGGWGVTKDRDKAEYYYTKAAEAGNRKAINILRRM